MSENNLNNLKSRVIETSKEARNQAIKDTINYRIQNGYSQRQAILECAADEGWPLSESAIYKIIKS